MYVHFMFLFLLCLPRDIDDVLTHAADGDVLRSEEHAARVQALTKEVSS